MSYIGHASQRLEYDIEKVRSMLWHFADILMAPINRDS